MRKKCCSPRKEAEADIPLDGKEADRELAKFAKALGHPLRVRILRILAQQTQCFCGEMVALLPVAQSTVSQHLKILKEAGLIQGEIEGPKVRYCLCRSAMRRFKTFVSAI